MSNEKSEAKRGDNATKPRGFAAMTPERRREIAGIGGRAAHEQGRAPEFTSEEARAAGAKGGEVVSKRPGYMAEIGRRGGQSSSVDREHMREIGRAGAKAAHEKGSAHKWTSEEAKAARRKVRKRNPAHVESAHNEESK